MLTNTTSKNTVVFARMNEDIVDLIRTVSEARGENMSTFVRRAVLRELAMLSYLNPAQKKALQVDFDIDEIEGEKK